MTNEDFEQHYYPKYRSVSRPISRKHAMTNDSLVEALYQEGLIALWSCNPKQARDNPDAFIRQAVKFRMIDFLRKEKLTHLESLEARLERGEEIVVADSGDLELVTNFKHSVTVSRRRRWDETEETDPEVD